MSFADEEEFAAFLSRDDLLRQLSDSAVAEALAGFPLQLVQGRDMAWLAMATRRALGVSLRNVSEGPDRPSNAEVRADLVRLTEHASEAWLALFQRSYEVDTRLWDEAFAQWEGLNALNSVEDPEFGYNRFVRALEELQWLCDFLSATVRGTEEQRGNWRSAERRRERIWRGQFLAPIFEAAFGQPATANNHPHGPESGPSAFMIYYQKVVALAFGEQATPDISGVLKAACRLHRQTPVEFAEGIIPEL